MSRRPREDFYSEKPVAKSRKAHRCTLCRHDIPRGTSYVSIAACSCGEVSSTAAHVACLEAMKHASAEGAAA